MAHLAANRKFGIEAQRTASFSARALLVWLRAAILSFGGPARSRSCIASWSRKLDLGKPIFACVEPLHSVAEVEQDYPAAVRLRRMVVANMLRICLISHDVVSEASIFRWADCHTYLFDRL